MQHCGAMQNSKSPPPTRVPSPRATLCNGRQGKGQTSYPNCRQKSSAQPACIYHLQMDSWIQTLVKFSRAFITVHIAHTLYVRRPRHGCRSSLAGPQHVKSHPPPFSGKRTGRSIIKMPCLDSQKRRLFWKGAYNSQNASHRLGFLKINKSRLVRVTKIAGARPPLAALNKGSFLGQGRSL